MYLQKLIFILLLFYTTSFAYTDNDIDGVEDSIDQCLNTPFDELVNEKGCSHNESYHGVLTLKLGSDISFDTLSDKTTNFNLFTNYRYNNWDVSLSNSSYSTYDSFNETSNSAGDLYLSGGYLFKTKEFNTKIALGTKLAIADEDVGTGENDYFASVNFDYFVNQQQDIFLYLGYTMSGDSTEVDYEDFYSYSLGSGYAINSKWYSALSYDYSGSQYPNTDAYSSLSWFNSYEFNKQFFVTLNYAHGLDDISYDHTISLKFGVHFE
jgi:hypothetical protein